MLRTDPGASLAVSSPRDFDIGLLIGDPYYARGLADHGKALYGRTRLVQRLAEHSRPAPVDTGLGLPPRLTVTALHGGDGYSVVPDRCVVNVDVRLTHTFDAAAARALLQRVVTDLDHRHPGPAPEILWEESWPAYRLDDTAAVRGALMLTATRHLPQPPAARVAGPVEHRQLPGQAGASTPQQASASATRACTAPTNAST